MINFRFEDEAKEWFYGSNYVKMFEESEHEALIEWLFLYGDGRPDHEDAIALYLEETDRDPSEWGLSRATELDALNASDALGEYRNEILEETSGMSPRELDGFVSSWQNDLAEDHRIFIEEDDLLALVLKWIGDVLKIEVWYEDEVPPTGWVAEVYSYKRIKAGKSDSHFVIKDATDVNSAIVKAMEYFDTDDRGVVQHSYETNDGNMVYVLTPTSNG